jgi:hypothetical protein
MVPVGQANCRRCVFPLRGQPSDRSTRNVAYFAGPVHFGTMLEVVPLTPGLREVLRRYQAPGTHLG